MQSEVLSKGEQQKKEMHHQRKITKRSYVSYKDEMQKGLRNCYGNFATVWFRIGRGSKVLGEGGIK